MSTKTNSVFTLQPVIMNEGAPAMKWANNYDKKAIRAAYLGSNFAGKGSEMGSELNFNAGTETAGSVTPQPAQITPQPPRKDTPKQDYGFPAAAPKQDGRGLPSLPVETPNENLQTPGPPTAPPPPVPEAPLPLQSEPRNLETAEAAHVPLPAATPMEPPSKDGEPLELTQTNTEEDTNGVTSEGPTLDVKKDPKKLKKQPGQGGLRNIFGKRKAAERTPPSGPAPTSQAVAAARAAYTGPSMKANYNNSPTSLGRRLSAMGRKRTPPAPTYNAPPATTDEAAPPLPAPPATYNANQSQASMTSTQQEQQNADREFQTFDQHGPIDQPAFVPPDSPRPSFIPESEVSRPSTNMTEEPRRPMYAPPIGKGEYAPTMTDDGEMDQEDRAPSPEKNRWSQLRKNAAERAGRASEDQRTEDMRDTTAETEDGEDSGGEESMITFPFPAESLY